MKKLVSCFLAIMMMAAMLVPALAEEDSNSVPIEPLLLAIFDNTAAEWMEDNTSRAFLATCALMDAILSDYDEFDSYLADSVTHGYVYVAQDDDYLSIYYFTAEKLVLFSYGPHNSDLVVGLVDYSAPDASTAESTMSYLKSSGTIASYYKVSNEDVLTVYKLISDELSK